jgi:hypothetical protein
MMGAYATLYVSRKAAMLKLAEHLFDGFDNCQLAEALNHRFGDRLYNFSVGYDENDEHDDEELERL